MSVQPAIFLSHGSPHILLDDSPAHHFLAELGTCLDKPDAIIVFSAHWETVGLKIMATENPETIYDFHGFSPTLYTLTYPAQGLKNLAEHIQSLLKIKNIDSDLDTKRGYDHGVWIPLLLIYPKADIPVLQISIPRSASPADMMKIGQALSSLRHQNILILGSGSLTHNLYEFKGQTLDAPAPLWVSEFALWMRDKLLQNEHRALLEYRISAPYAVQNHPTEEHLLPLFAIMGAGDNTTPKHLHSSYNHSILAMDAYGFGL